MRKSKKVISLFIILILIILPIFTVFENNLRKAMKNQDTSLSIKASIISIDGDIELQNNASSGLGTPDNPYIIENYTINCSNVAGDGVWIRNTTKHFIFRNSKVFREDFLMDGCVKLENVSNVIIKNISTNGTIAFGCGISFYNSKNVTITNNTAQYSFIGIGGGDSTNVSICNNTIFDTYDGIRTAGFNFSISFNNASNNILSGVSIYPGSNHTWIYNNSVSNMSDGMGICLIQSNYSRVFNNTANNNNGSGGSFGNGITLWGAHHNNVSFNVVNDNNQSGIYLLGSNNNIITGNVLLNNKKCVNLTDSIDNIIRDNGCFLGTTIDVILPEISYDGTVFLNWTDIPSADRYYVYRSISKIHTVVGLDPIDNVSTNNYTDEIATSGKYYYVIVAGNSTMNSTISNCKNVTIQVSNGNDPQPPPIPGFEWLYGILVLIFIASIIFVKKQKRLDFRS